MCELSLGDAIKSIAGWNGNELVLESRFPDAAAGVGERVSGLSGAKAVREANLSD